jgi:hypothetical protein
VGLTFGFTLTGIASVVVRRADRDKTSVAAGVNSVLRTTGSAIATAAAAALMQAPASPASPRQRSGTHAPS